MASEGILRAIAVCAQLHARELSEDAVRIFASDLADYPEQAVLAAFARCRKELRTFPTPADVIARIDDGRPGPDEAWAMLPKSEADTVVWTEEMCDAFARCKSLIDDDPIAARMAFREAYTKLLADARASGRPARWGASLGHDRGLREGAVREAVRLGRLTEAEANRLLPEPVATLPVALLSAPEESAQDLTALNPIEMVRQIRERIEKAGET